MSQNAEQAEKTSKPPYLPWKTLKGYLETLKENGVPGRFDRSVMPSTMSGSAWAQVTGALKYFKLLNENDTPTEDLSHLVNSEGEERAKALRAVLTRGYSFLLDDENLPIERATTRQVEEKFKDIGMSGDTIRKAISLFMLMADEAGVKVSPHINPYNTRKNSAPKPRKTSATTPNNSQSNNETLKAQSSSSQGVRNNSSDHLEPIKEYGHVSRIQLSENRQAVFSIPDKLSSRDAQKLKGALKGLTLIIDSWVDDEEDVTQVDRNDAEA